MHELLSGCGDLESLKAAINAGADAVYLGLKSFSARSFAKNFTRDEFIEGVKYAHLYNVKVYVTMNTLVRNEEVNDFLDDVDFLYNNNADALLIQDFGMMMLVLKMYPDLPVHASTQANNASLETIKFLKDIGVSRVVLPREMSLEEASKIDFDIELETFIHGALCISYSGECLMSSMIGGRSANRGSCTYCCRMPYDLYNESNKINSGYLLSTKELNTAPSFNELMNSNILSFKIEGRMKSPEYVYYVTKFYRNIMDGKGYTKENMDILKILFNRDFTTGHLFNEDIMNTKSSSHKGLLIGEVLSFDKNYIKLKVNRTLRQGDGIRINDTGFTINYLFDKKENLINSSEDICFIKNTFDVKIGDAIYLTSSSYLKNKILSYEEKKIPIDIKVNCKVGEKLSITINNKITVYGKYIDKALKTPTSKDDIINKINRLGDTPYYVNKLDISISDDSFVPASILNELRREAINKYMEYVLSFKRDGKKNISFDKISLPKLTSNSLIIYSKDDFNNNYSRFYTSNYDLFNEYKDKYNIYYIEDRELFNSKLNLKYVSNHYTYGNHSIANYTFNVFNIYTAYFLYSIGYDLITISPELSIEYINNFIELFKSKFLFNPNIECLNNSRVVNMTIKGNILNISKDKYYYLVNRNNLKFPVYFDGTLTYIFNYENSLLNCKALLRDDLRYL